MITVQLPTPEDRPGTAVVIYDGDCRFCTAQVQRLARWDRRQKLSFLSLHDPAVSELCPDLTHDDLMREMYLLNPDQQRFAGAAAFQRLTRMIPRLWPLAPLLHIPFSLPLWQWLYRQFAKRRYRFGKTTECEGTCSIHFR